AEPSSEEAARLAESETWQSDDLDLSVHPEDLSSVQVTPQDDSTVAESLESDGFKEHFPLETPSSGRRSFEATTEIEDMPEVELVSLQVARLHNLFSNPNPTAKQTTVPEALEIKLPRERSLYVSPEEKGSKDSKRTEYEKRDSIARTTRGVGSMHPSVVSLAIERLTGGITPDRGENEDVSSSDETEKPGSSSPRDEGGGDEEGASKPPTKEEAVSSGEAGDSEKVDRGTSPLDEMTSPVSLGGGKPPSPHAESPLVERTPGPARAPTLELVIGRKEVHTRDASASSESRLTLYGARDLVKGFEISIRSQSHISVTTTTKESGRETSQRVDVGLTTSAGTGSRADFPVSTPESMGVARERPVVEEEVSGAADEPSTEGREYLVRHPEEDIPSKDVDVREKFETEVKEKRKEAVGGETVIFSGEKSVYRYESEDAGGYSPFESPTTESAAHITDTGIGMTRTDTATTDTDTVTSPVHRPPVSDTAVDTEAELTDAGFSPIQTEVALPGLEFFRDNVTYSDAAISPVYAPGVNVALSPLQVETSEAGILTDAIETRDAGISPVKLSLSESTSPISIEGPTAQTQIPERMDVASSPIAKDMLDEKPRSIIPSAPTTYQVKSIPSSHEKSIIRDRPTHISQVISSRPKEVEEIVERRRRDSGDVKTMVRMLEEGSLPRPPEDTPPEKEIEEAMFPSSETLMSLHQVRDGAKLDSITSVTTTSIEKEKGKQEEKIKYYESDVAVHIESKKKRMPGTVPEAAAKAVITHTKIVGPKIKQLQRFFTQEQDIEKETKITKSIYPSESYEDEIGEDELKEKLPPKATAEETSPIEEEKPGKIVDRRDVEISKLIESMELSLEPPELWAKEKSIKQSKKIIQREKRAVEPTKVEETIQEGKIRTDAITKYEFMDIEKLKETKSSISKHEEMKTEGMKKETITIKEVKETWKKEKTAGERSEQIVRQEARKAATKEGDRIREAKKLLMEKFDKKTEKEQETQEKQKMPSIKSEGIQSIDTEKGTFNEREELMHKRAQSKQMSESIKHKSIIKEITEKPQEDRTKDIYLREEEIEIAVTPKEKVVSREVVVEELVTETPAPIEEAITKVKVEEAEKEMLPKDAQKIPDTLKTDVEETEVTTWVKEDVQSERKEDVSPRELVEEPKITEKSVIPVSLERIPDVEKANDRDVVELVEEEKVTVEERIEMVDEEKMLRDEVVEEKVIVSEVTRKVE
ncbi:hypothetical protein J437_LFUL009650, partial [Ladona fulva]